MHTISILYIQLLRIIKIHSIFNRDQYFHSMTFYGFSNFFAVNVANIITKKFKKATHCMESMISSENIFKQSKTRKTT